MDEAARVGHRGLMDPEPTSAPGEPNRGTGASRRVTALAVVGALVAGGVFGFATSNRCVLPHRLKTTVVWCFIAKRRIPAGTVIEPDDFSRRTLVTAETAPAESPDWNDRVKTQSRSLAATMFDDPGFAATAGITTRDQLRFGEMRTLQIEIAEGEVLRDQHLGIGAWFR